MPQLMKYIQDVFLRRSLHFSSSLSDIMIHDDDDDDEHAD